MRIWAQETNHAQTGDPVKGAAAMVAVVTAPNPPSRIQLGSDSVQRVVDKLALVQRELDQWRELSLSTAHDDALVS